MEKKAILLLLLTLFLFSQIFVVSAQMEDGDIGFYGLELEKLLAFINGFIALALFIFAFVAYQRTDRKRLLFVSLAFFLFSVKSFLVSSEMFIADISWIDPVATILEFAVLLSFFYGLLKK